MTKQCAVCGEGFGPTRGRSCRQWEQQRFCSRTCGNTWKARQQQAKPWVQTYQARAAGGWWEAQRRREECAELRCKPKVGPHCKLFAHLRPKPRRFVGWWCKSCGAAFVYFSSRAQSPYCAACNHAHHRRSGSRRAKQNGARYEVIVPERVFERDGHRCQLCSVATSGVFPAPDSPTVDHIVPLAKGGDHLYANVQCSCFECNWRKADGAANDQLRFV